MLKLVEHGNLMFVKLLASWDGKFVKKIGVWDFQLL